MVKVKWFFHACKLVREDKESINWMIQTFKQRNSDCHRTRVVMADKDINKRNIIKEALPNAQILICLFHILWTFCKKISCEKHLNKEYSSGKSEEDYNVLYSSENSPEAQYSELLISYASAYVTKQLSLM